MTKIFFKDIDAAFSNHFELIKYPEIWVHDPSSSQMLDKKVDVEILSLKEDWVINKLKSACINGSPQELIHFFDSLPYGFAIQMPEDYETYIAILRERFLFTYILEKRKADGIFTHAGRDTEFHDFYSSQDPKTQLDNDILSGLKCLRLKNIIDKQYCAADVYFELPFLAACFNFFLHTLYATYDSNQPSEYFYGDAVKATKRFFFEDFISDLKDERLNNFEKFLDTHLKENRNIPNFYLGFKKFRAYDKDDNYGESVSSYYNSLGNDNLRGGVQAYLDVHPVYDEGSLVKDCVVINNMIGASKLILRYKKLIDTSDIEYLRYEKPYFGEPTFIKLQKKVINESDFRIDDGDDWAEKTTFVLLKADL
tara:strand:+ start:237 stop:1337 length:1101 start_codon:yes stop_codon:yes gene_type:complete